MVNMESDFMDRRRHARYTVHVDALMDAEGASLPILILDISLSGLGIQSLKNLQPDTQVSISLQIPDEVIFYGTLIWSQHQLINNLDAYKMGFEVYAIRYQSMIYDELSEDETILHEILAEIKQYKESEE